MILAFFEICLPDNSSNQKKTMILAMNDANMVPLPIIPIIPFDKYFRPNPLIKKPMKGKSGIKRIKFFIFKLSALSYQLSAFAED
jgi:hypothetical protein